MDGRKNEMKGVGLRCIGEVQLNLADQKGGCMDTGEGKCTQMWIRGVERRKIKRASRNSEIWGLPVTYIKQHIEEISNVQLLWRLKQQSFENSVHRSQRKCFEEREKNRKKTHAAVFMTLLMNMQQRNLRNNLL